jgi:hypothetical protein
MNVAWNKFQKSEHSKLECHQCHRQSQYANARQLFLWVAVRPSDIPKHGKVPTKVCAECHIQKNADSTWKRVIATSGHRVHMKSDSAALKNIECVTCHGQEVHHFTTVDKTCGQAGCHNSSKTQVTLGKMAGQTSQHCTGCHSFTVPVKETLSIDSTKKYLVPSATTCLGCHAMQKKMGAFNVATDKHAGMCGSCHDAHKDKLPKDALTRCGNSGCHSKPLEETPFHRGIPAASITKCESCHKAHTWKTDGTSCQSCHKDIFTNEGRTPPGLPSKAAVAPEGPNAPTRVGPQRRVPGLAVGFAPVRWIRAAWQSIAPQTVTKSPKRKLSRVSLPPGSRPFKHGLHKNMLCSACHSSSERHGALTVTKAADCAACHHAADQPLSCEGCHSKSSLANVSLVTNTIKLSVWKLPKERTANFKHSAHIKSECKDCHSKGPGYAPQKDCSTCHEKHHTAESDCRSCHVGVKDLHKRTVHQGCAVSGCHVDKSVAALSTSRQVCLSCHVEMANHKRGGDCAECHKVTWTPQPVLSAKP